MTECEKHTEKEGELKSRRGWVPVDAVLKLYRETREATWHNAFEKGLAKLEDEFRRDEEDE